MSISNLSTETVVFFEGLLFFLEELCEIFIDFESFLLEFFYLFLQFVLLIY